jgi:hypothetical protein
MEWFRNRVEAKIVIEDWRIHYSPPVFEFAVRNPGGIPPGLPHQFSNRGHESLDRNGLKKPVRSVHSQILLRSRDGSIRKR